MKILDISQSQNMYKTPESQIGGEDKREDQKNIFEKMPEAEVVISEEGLAAWAEEIKKRTGNIGALTGWEDTSQYAVGAKNEVSFEHFMELGKIKKEIRSKSYKNGDSADIAMKSLLEAYEILYNKIMEQHKTGKREVNYSTGFRSVSLEEDLEALDEAYDQWLGHLDTYVLLQQRRYTWYLTPVPRGRKREIEEPKYYLGSKRKYNPKFMTEEYHEYRRNITVMMKQGREELLAALKTTKGENGLAAKVLTNLMNGSADFWVKTRELWPDEKHIVRE